MLELAPASREDLEAFCAALGSRQAAALRTIIERVCADPSGRREPKHSYTRRFRNPERYLGKRLPSRVKVWEFRPPRYRGLFITDERYVVFLRVRGKRFMTVDECPWH